MEKNVGHPLDKTLRIVVGVALLSLIFLLEGPARWIGLIGIIPIVTVFIGWCPGWALLGVNTRRRPGHF
ncbi:DUF2892 domain-containing protein [Ectothiorhodospiraceae bacterium 2226]|nr:DUF2892 domain-containing protein [Ectothiorhodospiraceae bacterium 2226]